MSEKGLVPCPPRITSSGPKLIAIVLMVAGAVHLLSTWVAFVIFGSFVGRFCDMVRNPPMISRDAGSAMKRRRRKHESTAYHGAGHAVAAFVLALKIGKRGVSIVRDRENDLVGLAHVPVQVRERPDCAVSGRTRLHLEKQAIMCFAGDAAERKFDGRRRFGGHRDYQHAAELLAPLATSWEQHDARIEVARLGARDIVEATWSSIQAVAEELLRKKTLNAADVKAIVLRCERELDSS